MTGQKSLPAGLGALFVSFHFFLAIFTGYDNVKEI
jgi:hypothetical protein